MACVSGYCHQVHRRYETSHHSFHSPPKKWWQTFKFGCSMALHSPQRMPLSLLSLSELESAQNLAGSCLTVCNRLLTSHSDSLLLPGDSIAAWTGCLPFLGLPCFLFSFVFFSFPSSLSFFFLCLSSYLLLTTGMRRHFTEMSGSFM